MESNDYPKYKKSELKHIIKDHNHKIVWCSACGFTIRCGYCGKNVCETDYFDRKKFRKMMEKAPTLSIRQLDLARGPSKYQLKIAKDEYKEYVKRAKRECEIICSDNCDEAKMLYDRRKSFLSIFQRIKNFFHCNFVDI